jgi:hypothetical protein
MLSQLTILFLLLLPLFAIIVKSSPVPNMCIFSNWGGHQFNVPQIKNKYESTQAVKNKQNKYLTQQKWRVIEGEKEREN